MLDDITRIRYRVRPSPQEMSRLAQVKVRVLAKDSDVELEGLRRAAEFRKFRTRTDAGEDQLRAQMVSGARKLRGASRGPVQEAVVPKV